MVGDWQHKGRVGVTAMWGARSRGMEGVTAMWGVRSREGGWQLLGSVAVAVAAVAAANTTMQVSRLICRL